METVRYILPLELTEAAKAAEAEIRKSIEHVEGAYLVRRHVAIFHIEEDGIRAELTANELIEFFSYLRPLTLDSATPVKRATPEPKLSSRAGHNILRFTFFYFDEIRAQICKGKKQSLGTTTHGALVALASWLSGHLGMESSVVTGVAAAILIAALTATKGAFCKMTAPEAKAALTKAETK